ncbi:MAG: hypothetical protein HC900_09220 [Methylacidiphilales bacterium]|nr:hypothetical protein [Candidatus Methylacidiphilales bacterium]
MNRIVRENYPVSKLPEDLRGDIEPGASVTVTVVAETRGAPQRFAELRQRLGQGRLSLADAVERVRKIREGEAF